MHYKTPANRTLDDVTEAISRNRNALLSQVPEYDSLGRRKVSTTKGIPAIDRFIAKVLIDTETGCWEWHGAKSTAGYGQFKPYYADSFKTSPHRFIYEYFNGEIPENEEIDHDPCNNRGCCNPAHLKSVTHAVNKSRSVKTHCKRGHELTGENVYISPSTGNRACNLCRKLQTTKWQKENREHLLKYQKHYNDTRR